MTRLFVVIGIGPPPPPPVSYTIAIIIVSLSLYVAEASEGRGGGSHAVTLTGNKHGGRKERGNLDRSLIFFLLLRSLRIYSKESIPGSLRSLAGRYDNSIPTRSQPPHRQFKKFRHRVRPFPLQAFKKQKIFEFFCIINFYVNLLIKC